MDAESVLPLDLGIGWSAGAPVPVVLAGEEVTYLAFELAAVGGESFQTGLIEWRGCLAFSFGFPNDEVQHGHRLWRGTGAPPPYYGAAEVSGSRWIEDLRATERIHPSAPKDPFAGYRHLVLLFHDSTFECVVRGWVISRHVKSVELVLTDLASRVAVHQTGDIRER